MKIGSENWNQLIVNGAKQFNITINDEILSKFALYAKELLIWNKKINLTAITDPLEIAINHFLDSIILSYYIHKESYVIDIGSGAGFPGVPLAITFPQIRVHLIDSSRKKISFLKHVVRYLNISNVSVDQMRAEDVAIREKFVHANNVVVSRALFSIEKLISIAIPLMKKGGEIIAMKGKKASEDKQLTAVLDTLNEWEKNSDKRNYTYAIHTYTLYNTGGQRSLFRFKFMP